MFRKLYLTAAMALALTTGQATAESKTKVVDFDFSFEGITGKFDQNQLQRGLKIYTEVCSACHGLELIAFRTLSDEGGPGLPEDQMRAYADFYEVFDQALFDGEGDFRPATPADHFPAVTGAGAPDLSLMAKARAGFHGPYGTGISQLVNGMGGAEYIASLLSGYAETPACAPEDFSGFYNTAFAYGGFPEECKDDEGHHKVIGSWISMGPPLEDGWVEFDDGHANDVVSMSEDVSAFLMWTAEPKMMARKQSGLTGVIILSLLSVLLYLTNKKLWAPHKHKD